MTVKRIRCNLSDGWVVGVILTICTLIFFFLQLNGFPNNLCFYCEPFLILLLKWCESLVLFLLNILGDSLFLIFLKELKFLFSDKMFNVCLRRVFLMLWLWWWTYFVQGVIIHNRHFFFHDSGIWFLWYLTDLKNPSL